MHAERDVTEKIRNNRASRVDMNEFKSVGMNKQMHVAKDSALNIGKNYSINVGTVKMATLSQIGLGDKPEKLRKRAYLMSLKFAESTGRGNYSVNATGNINISSHKSVSMDMQGNNFVNVGQNAATNIAGNLHETISGKHSQVIGKSLMIDAHQKLTLRSGESKIELNPDGSIVLEGKHVAVRADRIDLN